ncbi:hypothetical protein AOX61_10240 [Pseudomonas aeruginosa]|nr:hypothetical protein AOX61_10240 [Pseudomonas aeruginosa]KQK66956.1 hypothetical protein AOX62_01625 [Pseudomonas aeruginosa]
MFSHLLESLAGLLSVGHELLELAAIGSGTGAYCVQSRVIRDRVGGHFVNTSLQDVKQAAELLNGGFSRTKREILLCATSLQQKQIDFGDRLIMSIVGKQGLG